MQRQLRYVEACYDVAVFGHTHKPRVQRDQAGRLLINLGETDGWSFGRPTVALLEMAASNFTVVELK